MRTQIIALLICTAALGATVSCSPERTLNLMSYNVDNCFGTDSIRSVSRVAEIILAEAPDIVALQQLDSMTARSPFHTLDQLAEETSMIAVYGPAQEFEGGTTGVGILSKEPPLSTRTIPLPGKPEEGTVMLVAEYRKFCFASIAMPGSISGRIAAVALVKEEAARTGKPFLFGGSLNARLGSQTISSLAKDFTILTDIGAKTYPADKPTSLVDYLFIYNRNIDDFRVGELSVLDQPVASDHRPVVAEISFK